MQDAEMLPPPLAPPRVGTRSGSGSYSDAPEPQTTQRRSPQDSSSSSPADGDATSSSRSPDPRIPIASTSSSSAHRGSSQIADKSCARCRERKVRCDRGWPVCRRCRLRHEECTFPDIVNIETTNDGAEADAERIVRLETKLASLEEKLARIPPPTSSSSPSSSNPTPPPPPPASGPAPSSSQMHLTPASIASDLSTAIYLAVMRDTDHHQGATARMFLEHMHQQSNIGFSNPNWRLGVPSLARSLTYHLLPASMQACCSRLPSLQLIHKRIIPLRDELHMTDLLAVMDSSKRLGMTIICALGARSSPHSALMGVDCPGLDDGSAPPTTVLSAGMRRENAAKGLTEQALSMCYGAGVMVDVNRVNLEAVIGLIQLMIFEEIFPRKARFLLRNAIGMFKELQYSMTPDQLQDVRKELGPILFDFDSLIAAQLSIPCLITQAELDTDFPFETTPERGLRIPDFENESIGGHLDTIIQKANGRLGKESLLDSLAATSCWVSGAERKFASLSTARALASHSVLTEMRNLWRWIDDLHTRIQQMQQLFVNINYPLEGMQGDDWALDHFILLGVRADTRVVDLVNLMHKFLEAQHFSAAGQSDSDEDKEPWNDLRKESELRVRKCLKLVAFYSKLYLSSRDKHVVYHLVLSLELLSNWPDVALKRVGQQYGPQSAEYEVTDEEADWLVRSLQLACYYTPRAASKLQALVSGRQSRPAATLAVQQSGPVSSTSASAAEHGDGLMASGRTEATESPFSFHETSEAFAPITATASSISSFPYAWDVDPSQGSYQFDSYGTATGGQAPVDQMGDIASAFGGRSWLRTGDPTLTAAYDLLSDEEWN